MTEEIPFAQIKRVMKKTPTDLRISKDAVLELEKIVISQIQKWCEKAKNVMRWKDVITIQPEFLEFGREGINGIEEAKIFKAPIERLIYENGIERIGEGTWCHLGRRG